MPYANSVACNTMLLSFLIMNEEAWLYFQNKCNNWKNNGLGIPQNTIANHPKVGAQKREEQVSSARENENIELFVIDV